MKKLRPFLALLLACWLLALPALADDEIGGDTSQSPPVSDSVEDTGSSSSEETPSENPPASEDPPSEGKDPSDTSDDTLGTTDPDPVDPGTVDPGTVAPGTVDPGTVDPGTVDPGTVDPGTVDPGIVDPGTVDPGTVDPGIVDPGTVDPGTVDPGTVDPDIVNPDPVDPLPVYPVPDASVSPGLQETPDVIYEAGAGVTPAVEEHQVFTITTIPEFALAALESDAGNTMAQVVRDLFGTYTPRIQTVTTYMDGEPIAVEEQYVPGVAGMDWEWIGGFAVFLLMLYCLFRLLGGSVKYG